MLATRWFQCPKLQEGKGRIRLAVEKDLYEIHFKGLDDSLTPRMTGRWLDSSNAWKLKQSLVLLGP